MFGYIPQFPCLQKDSIIHQGYVKVYTPSIEPGSQPMDDVEDFDELSLDLSTLSKDSNDNMKITSVIDNRVGSVVKFSPTFDSRKNIISTYDKRFQDYYKAAIDGKGANYIVNYILTKEANSYSRRSDSNTLLLFLYCKLISILSQKESAVFVCLIDHILYMIRTYTSLTILLTSAESYWKVGTLYRTHFHIHK